MDTGALALVTAMGALLLAGLVGAFALPLGRGLGLLDFPDYDGGRKRHQQVTPLVGGIAVGLAAIGAALAVLALGGHGPAVRLHLVWLAATLGAMLAIGLADDRFQLGPKLRLAAAIVMLLLVVIYAHDFSLPMLRFGGFNDMLLLPGAWGPAFALLCLVGLLNAVNMADGKNGVVIGMALIWTAALLGRQPGPMLPVLAAAGAALIVLFAYNMRGRLFLGDAGSYALSALYGLLAIHTYNHRFATMRAEDVAVLFAIPVFDTVRLMASRALAGGSPFDADRDHLHHHLHRACGWPRGLWVYLALLAVPNAGVLLWPGSGLFWLVATLAAYAGVLAATRRATERPA